jgi:hypothetical protein
MTRNPCRDVPWNVSTLFFTRCLLYVTQLLISRGGKACAQEFNDQLVYKKIKNCYKKNNPEKPYSV